MATMMRIRKSRTPLNDCLGLNNNRFSLINRKRLL
jgi:hypothetical protein